MKAKEHLKKIKEIIDVERGYSLGVDQHIIICYFQKNK